MPNPWLTVPLEDYERHMSAESVDQLAPLARLFGRALEVVRPRSVAMLGIAGGNGLEAIDPTRVERIAGFDFHPDYLAAVRERWGRRLPQLELIQLDLTRDRVNGGGFDLVHAALVFEHTGLGQPMENALALTAPSGWLSIVLQRPSTQTPGVAATGVASIAALSERFTYIDPMDLTTLLRNGAWELHNKEETPLAGGKGLWWGLFRAKP